jgi:hypothetical protein
MLVLVAFRLSVTSAVLAFLLFVAQVGNARDLGQKHRLPRSRERPTKSPAIVAQCAQR